MLRPAERLTLLAILTLVGLVLRLGYWRETAVVNPIRADAAQYVQYARNLVQHQVFSLATEQPVVPDSYRSPGYPAFLALVLLAAGESGFYEAVRLVQALLGALLVPLAFLLARTWLAPGACLLVAALTALSPHLVASTGYVLSEALFAPLLLTALVCTQRIATRRTPWSGVLAGLAFGLAALCNETAALLPPLLAVIHWRRGSEHRAWLAFAATGVLVAGAWQVRNRLTVGEEAPSGGERVLATLSHGTYPDFFFATEACRKYPYKEDPEQPEFGSSPQRFVQVFEQRFAQSPLRYLAWYVLEKPLHLWGWNIVQGQGDVYVYEVGRSLYAEQPVAGFTRVLMKLLHPLLVVAAAVALLRRRVPILVAATLLYFTCIYTLFLPCPRYVTPLRPMLFIAGICGFQALRAVWHEVAVAAQQWRPPVSCRVRKTGPGPGNTAPAAQGVGGGARYGPDRSHVQESTLSGT